MSLARGRKAARFRPPRSHLVSKAVPEDPDLLMARRGLFVPWIPIACPIDGLGVIIPTFRTHNIALLHSRKFPVLVRACCAAWLFALAGLFGVVGDIPPRRVARQAFQEDRGRSPGAQWVVTDRNQIKADQR